MGVIQNLGIVVFLCSILLEGCATGAVDDASRDPLEPINRFVYGINKAIDRTVVLPVAWLYLEKAPKPVRNSLHNFLDNLALPITFANDLLQGEVTRAGDASGRFVINSTIGLGGVLDIASDWGVPEHSSDFGQTLSVYGVGEGPFLVLPIFGPDCLRDFSGQVVDLAMDPFNYLAFQGSLRDAISWDLSRGFLRGLEPRARGILLTQSLNDPSFDEYVTMRSVFRQQRAAVLRARQANGFQDLPDVP